MDPRRDWVVKGIVACSLIAMWMDQMDLAIYTMLGAGVLLLYWIAHGSKGYDGEVL